jgi:arsenate reductase
MTTLLYGIPNCDTVKRARTWLESNGVDYTFHDFKKQGVDEKMLRAWLKHVLATLLNKKGTTYRALSDADKARRVRSRRHRADADQPVADQASRAGPRRQGQRRFSADGYAALF